MRNKRQAASKPHRRPTKIDRVEGLVKEVEIIEEMISRLCTKISLELGTDVGWSDVRELNGKMTLTQMKRVAKGICPFCGRTPERCICG